MKKILVIQTAFIGDAILSTSVLETLHAEFPNAQLDILVRKGNESLFKEHPFIGETIIWDKKNGKWKSLWRSLMKIRSAQYDAVFNLQRFASSGFLTVFSKAKIKAGFNKNPLAFGFTHQAKHQINQNADPEKIVHEIDRNFEVIAPFVHVRVSRPALYPSIADQEVVKPFIQNSFITISPASVWETKKTPLSKWVELILASPNVHIFLLGGPTDIEVCEALLSSSKAKNVTILAGKLSLLQSAALMKNALMNYVNDSGPLHLCSAVNAPTTAVFCSTLPAFGFTPLSDTEWIVESSKPLPCRPCGIHGHKQCPKGHFDCGNSITIEQILHHGI